MNDELIGKLIIYGIPLLFAVVVHEVAHGWVAWKLGDPTAKSLGRLTLNPLKHIDPVMTILLPALLIAGGSPVVFGGAKPVPFNPRYFRNPRKGMVLVAAAGPAVNFILAALFAGLLAVLPTPTGFGGALFVTMLFSSVAVNLVLALFNLIPVPPLDGGRIAVGLLPSALAIPLARLERWGLLIVFGLLYFGIVDSYLRTSLGFLSRLFGMS